VAEPNMEAFLAGVELALFTILFVIGSVLVANWIIRIMGSSK
jgi:hypothetical protein